MKQDSKRKKRKEQTGKKSYREKVAHEKRALFIILREEIFVLIYIGIIIFVWKAGNNVCKISVLSKTCSIYMMIKFTYQIKG